MAVLTPKYIFTLSGKPTLIPHQSHLPAVSSWHPPSFFKPCLTIIDTHLDKYSSTVCLSLRAGTVFGLPPPPTPTGTQSACSTGLVSETGPNRPKQGSGRATPLPEAVTYLGDSLVKDNKGVPHFLRTILDQIRKTPCCGISRTRVSSTRKTDVPKV